MSAIRRLLSISLLTLLFSGCSLAPKITTSTPAEPKAWQTQRDNLDRFQHWMATGKIGVRTPSESLSATFTWKQNSDQFNVDIRGPLGQGSASLQGDQYYASLEMPDEQPLSAGGPDELLALRLGWDLPVRDAHYWIKGIPSPTHNYQATFDGDKLFTLKQLGWTITYPRYANNGAIHLPEKLILTREGLKITLIINNWQKTD